MAWGFPGDVKLLEKSSCINHAEKSVIIISISKHSKVSDVASVQ